MNLPISHTIQVTSFGGTATTTILNWLIENNQNVARDQYWKHKIIPPSDSTHNLPENYKILYLVGDPVRSIISIFRRRILRAHAVNMECLTDVANWNMERYIKHNKDIFNIHKQLVNYTSAKVNYPILCVKYNSIWKHSDTICNFLNLDSVTRENFPKKTQRNMSGQFDKYVDQLRVLHKPSIDLINNLPDIFTLNSL